LLAIFAMHSAVRWSAVIFFVAIVGAQAVRPPRTNPAVIKATATLLPHAPADVARIIDRSCRDCHSNETRWPWYSNVAPMSWVLINHVAHGRDHFNYSEWATYSEDDQDKLLGSVCSLTRKGRMPLPSYLWIHRDAVLSAADIDTLCAWSDKMRDALQ
jgi:hypothetical protein